LLGSWLTDGGKVASLTRRPPFNSRKIPGSHFSQRLSQPQGNSAVGRIRSIEKSYDLIWNHTLDLPDCTIVPQPTTLSRYREDWLRPLKKARVHTGLPSL
jgi:hypothetical protein